jgi:hypothetical protein
MIARTPASTQWSMPRTLCTLFAKREREVLHVDSAPASLKENIRADAADKIVILWREDGLRKHIRRRGLYRDHQLRRNVGRAC